MADLPLADEHIEIHRRPCRRAWLKGPVVAMVLLTAAVSVACGTHSSAHQRVFRVTLIHVGLDHYPASLLTLVDGLQSLGWLSADQVRSFESEIKAVKRPTCSGEKITVAGPKMQLEWRNLKDAAAADQAAMELVQEKVDLIVAFEGQTIRAAHNATTTTPIVFLHAFEPEREGFIQSAAHPGANLTGIEGFPGIGGKQLEMFKNLVPSLRRVIAVTDPQDPRSPDLLADTEAAARTLGVVLQERPASDEAGIRSIFDTLKPGDTDGVVIASQDLQTKFSLLMIQLSLQHGLPISVGSKSRVQKGGLFSYSEDFGTVGALAAPYVDKILKGANPADLPVEPTQQLDLYVNQTVADQLGLTLSPQMLDIAAEVLHQIDTSGTVACQG
jgi:putative tryptophan/tyrosine transport system substrate-binding protein